REGLSLAEVRLRVADAHLNRWEREMRANAPPNLRVLVDRAGVVEEANVFLEACPAVVDVGNAAAREHAREDLRARGMQTAVHVLDKGRARRDRQQLGKAVPEKVAHGDRAVGA